MAEFIHGLGHNRTQAYRAWMSMRSRCNNENHHRYSYYGGRGIKVCPEWDSYLTFVRDMGDPPKGHTLDRIDTEGDYCAKNCRWATRATQSRNRRWCKITEKIAAEVRLRYNRGVVRQVDLAREYGITQPQISAIVTGRNWK